MKPLSHYCSQYNINDRTARRHVVKLGIGTKYGHTWVLTDAEWSQVQQSINNAKVGNPNWRKLQ